MALHIPPPTHKGSLLETALSWVASGLSVIPVKIDGSKRADLSEWKPYQENRPTDRELQSWFNNKARQRGVAIIGGAVSGGLEIVDFDNEETFNLFDQVVQACENLHWIKDLPQVKTPKGSHLYFRSKNPEGNQKLAMRQDADGKPKVLIETRGEGGYVIAPGSPAKCHPTEKIYEILNGDLRDIPTISPEQRSELLDMLRSFNEIEQQPDQHAENHARTDREPTAAGSGTRPGDDFNARADWLSVLKPHGWEVGYKSGQTLHMRRPGGEPGSTHATVNHKNSDLFYVFSTEAPPFEAEKGYTKFKAYTLLNHAGDFKAAAKELAKQGYGAQSNDYKRKKDKMKSANPQKNKDSGTEDFHPGDDADPLKNGNPSTDGGVNGKHDHADDMPTTVPYGWSLDSKGVYTIDEESDEKLKIKVSGPCWVEGFARDLSEPDSKSWGAVIRWIDRDNQLHERAVPTSKFNEPGATLCQELANGGLKVISGNEKKLMRFLSSFECVKRMQCVDKLGWIDDPEGKLAFVLPNTVITSKAADFPEKIIFQPETFSQSSMTIRQSGTLDEWKSNVVDNCASSKYLTFCLCLAFVAPLLKFVSNVQSFGFHPYGRSSVGKTTGAQASASAWGCGADPADAPDRAFIRKWNATINGMEGICAAHNDVLACLDEIGTCDAQNFGKLVYDIFGGVGKTALNQKRELKPIRTWRIVLLSTGEVSVKQRIEERGTKAKAGQLLRLIDIDITEVLTDENQCTMDLVKQRCAQFYGTAGPAFVQAIVTNTGSADLRRKIDQLMLSSLDKFPKLKSPEELRTTKAFALVMVAGLLAQEILNLPLTLKQISDAVLHVFNAWAKSSDQLADVDRGVRSVAAFIQRFRPSRIKNDEEIEYDDNGRKQLQTVRDIAAYSKPSKKLILFTEDGLKEASGNQDPKTVAKRLLELDLLFLNNAPRLKSKHNVRDFAHRLEYYAVHDRIVEYDACPTVPS